MQKVIFGISIVIILATGATAYSLYRDNAVQQQQLADYSDQVEELLAHIEENTAQRVDYENRIEQLNNELLVSGNRIKSLDNELVETREKIDPDLAQIEQQIRERVSNEYRRQYQRDEIPTAASLVEQLSMMSDEERMAIMSVQSQYGRFLDALNTSPERKATITEALVEINQEQTRARQELMSQGLPPRQARNQLRNLMGPQATRESLTYVLDEQELALFDETQPQSQIFARAAGANGVFEYRTLTTDQAQAIPLGADVIINAGDGTAPAVPGSPNVRTFIIEQAPAIDQ